MAYKISLFKKAKKKNKENFEYIWKGDTKL